MQFLIIFKLILSSINNFFYLHESKCNNKSSNQTIEPYFSVPPKLSPFQTTVLSLNVGDRASLTCSVVKGDSPLTITWRKDGRPIDLSNHMNVKAVDQYNSILVIEHLQPDHTGNYSCCVRNLAAEVENSQALLVNGNAINKQFSTVFFCSKKKKKKV